MECKTCGSYIKKEYGNTCPYCGNKYEIEVIRTENWLTGKKIKKIEEYNPSTFDYKNYRNIIDNIGYFNSSTCSYENNKSASGIRCRCDSYYPTSTIDWISWEKPLNAAKNFDKFNTEQSIHWGILFFSIFVVLGICGIIYLIGWFIYNV